ncbi:hypothetical protein QIS99_15090 [Streptomyces sp. B-S-A8]|uniref:Uncharacterized protein n=1 Tax=Streptomyces solicavernae TaxID=3043614 RepID=A0ABT6RSU9_9ACTN|nr:hypothetical protein [Streptomyces sp. B-S-A8]MDI3387513.1 hypothetical protein [Streptomyces sp. B-S-A8]
MARLVARKGELIVRLAWWEKLAARRGDVHVPLDAIEQVTADSSWWRVVRGTQGRGTWIPDVLSIGVRDVSGERDFVALRPRAGTVICVDLRPAASPFARVAVTDAVPDATAATLRTAAARLHAPPPPYRDHTGPA